MFASPQDAVAALGKANTNEDISALWPRVLRSNFADEEVEAITLAGKKRRKAIEAVV